MRRMSKISLDVYLDNIYAKNIILIKGKRKAKKVIKKAWKQAIATPYVVNSNFVNYALKNYWQSIQPKPTPLEKLGELLGYETHMHNLF